MKATFVPGISIELHVNGRALQEYEDEETTDGEHGVVTRYVEVVPDTVFSVHVFFEAGSPYSHDDIVLGIDIDGQEIARYCSSPKPHHHHPRHAILSEVPTNVGGVGRRNVFTFGELKTTDESLEKSEVAKFKEILSKLGEVTVWMVRGKVVGTSAPNNDPPMAPSRIGDSVPEKALKGRSISSRAGLKDAGPCAPYGTSIVEYPYGNNCFVKFTFKYRSRRDLQIEDIIPCSPSPTPLDELDLDSMTREQAIEVLRQQREQQAPTARVKRERAPTLVIYDDGSDEEEGEEGDVSITSVGPVKKRQRVLTDSGGDVIDLTDD